MRLYIFLSELVRKFPRLVAANLGLTVISGVLESLSLVNLVPCVDLIIHSGLEQASPFTLKLAEWMTGLGLPVNLRTMLLVTLALTVLTSASLILTNRSILHTKYVLLRDLMLGAYDDFFSASWQFFSRASQGKLLNTFIREIARIGDAFGWLATYSLSLTRLLIIVSVPLFISWQVTLIVAAAAVVLAAPFLLLSRYIYRLGQLNTSSGNQVLSTLHESLLAAKMILGFANQPAGREALQRVFAIHSKTTVISQNLNYAIPLAFKPLGFGLVILALYTARVFAVTLSETLILVLAVLQVLPLIGNLVANRTSFDLFFPSYEQVRDLRAQARSLAQFSGSRIFHGIERGISLEGVTFAHPGGEAPVLCDIHLHIPRGAMTAIVGRSGSGKSTLIDTIMGFHEPRIGSVLVDSVPLQTYDIRSYRRRIGYVPQDNLLFNMSIRDNLLWSNPEASEADLLHACRQANVDEFAENLQQGYDTIVGDRGVRLSGGQIQRVALARAILRRPALLILDEATSALDTHSERLIQVSIEALARETTVVVVAHRLSTIVNAGHIVVLQTGRVAEQGTYRDLLDKGAVFKQMVALQTLEQKS